MNRATSQTRALAGLLIAFELRGRKAGENKTPPAFPVCEKLRPQLATLMGGTGFHALLSRALAVAHVDDPWLRTVQVKADGSLGVQDDGDGSEDPEDIAESSAVLVSHLLALLVAFIGEALTLRMVRDAWPKLSLDESDFRKGDTK